MKPFFQVRRHPRARRLKLRVRPDASVEVVAPPGVTMRRIRQFVDAQHEWIERARSKSEAQRRPPAERGPFPTRLDLESEQVRLAVGYREAERDGWHWTATGLRVDLKEREPAGARSVLIEALKQRARSRLEPRLLALSSRHGLVPASVGWRNQKSRWGSCSSRGHLSLNVRLLFLPVNLVDYVFIHELAHLRHPDHSGSFWRCVAAMLPDYESARRDLRASNHRVPEWLL